MNKKAPEWAESLAGETQTGAVVSVTQLDGHMKYSLLSAVLLLSACSSQPVVVTEVIHQKVYAPIPSTLVAPVHVTLIPGVTYGEALGSLREGLSRCDSQLAAIATLKPPPSEQL